MEGSCSLFTICIDPTSLLVVRARWAWVRKVVELSASAPPQTAQEAETSPVTYNIALRHFNKYAKILNMNMVNVYLYKSNNIKISFGLKLQVALGVRAVSFLLHLFKTKPVCIRNTTINLLLDFFLFLSLTMMNNFVRIKRYFPVYHSIHLWIPLYSSINIKNYTSTGHGDEKLTSAF